MKKLLLLLFALAPSLATAQNAPSVTPPVLAAGAYNSAPPTCTTNNGCYLQTDSHGNLNVNIAGGGGSGGTSQTDQATFTYGTTAYTPMGGVYNSAITNLTSGQGGAVALTAARSMHVLEDNSASILSAVQSPIPAGTNNIGTVNLGTGLANVTATDCSGTIGTGGTAQNAFSAQTTLHGFTIVNIDTTEPLWISFTTTAAASGAGSYPLQAATATTFASAGSFTSPMGFGLNHALSVIATTTGHKFTCTWW